jgi:hypothetical protein
VLWVTHLKLDFKFRRHVIAHTVEGLEPGKGYTFKARK